MIGLTISIFRVSSFIEDFLLISFQQKSEIKKGKYLDRVQTFTFFSSIDLFGIKDFKRNLADDNLGVTHISNLLTVCVKLTRVGGWV